MDIERLGPYRIVGKLGHGGMGTVYDAVHSESGQPAAVKLLSAALAREEGFRNRFEAEIETLRKLNHPHIVRLFGFGEQDGHLFYAMERIDGNSLEEELRRGRRFDWREVSRIAIEVCRALRHAHDRGVIHRDIKPGNVLLTADGRSKLSDFGIARLFGNTRLTGAGNVLGTAEYMAPEQAEGRYVDARADLYSLGALMYALLARRPVFRAKSLVEMLQKQRFEQPEPVRKYAPDTPAELEHIIGELLEKDPANRVANADILARRLEAMLHALSMGPETLEAGASWFFSDSEAAQLPVGDDIPATQALSIEDGKRQPPPLKPASPTDGATAAPPSRFVVVGEDELGRIDEEEPRPAMVSIQTWVLAAALLLVGLSIWWFLQPPSADKLWNRIEAATADGAIDSILAAEDDIRKFLNNYSDDPRAGRLRGFEQEIELNRLERKFELHVKGVRSTKELQPIERAYLEAIRYLRLDTEAGMAKLQALIDLYSRPEASVEPSAQCLTLARRQLDKLRQEAAKNAAGQIELLNSRLDAADKLRAEDPARAAAMYRAAIELYADKPWAAAAIRRARDALKDSHEMPPASEPK
jgi:serine/threonine protein kinase